MQIRVVNIDMVFDTVESYLFTHLPRDGHPYIYIGPIKYGDYTNDMKTCGYCGFQFAGCYVHAISVTRNGKTREMYRCDECKESMKTYKVSNE